MTPRFSSEAIEIYHVNVMAPTVEKSESTKDALLWFKVIVLRKCMARHVLFNLLRPPGDSKVYEYKKNG